MVYGADQELAHEPVAWETGNFGYDLAVEHKPR